MILRYFLKTAILPPASSLLLALLALLIWRRWPRLARVSLIGSLLSLWLFSLPIVAHHLLASLESQYPPFTRADGAEAIVILGGGRRSDALEYGDDTVNVPTLERLRYGAVLHRQTQLPILVTGGRVFGYETVSEAQLMARVLRDEFAVPVQWLEVNSKTTAGNARFTAELLSEQNIHRVLLVTHAWHMPRAVDVFVAEGLQVIAAPTGYSSAMKTPVLNWLPSARALQKSHYALHEILGRWVYSWQYG